MVNMLKKITIIISWLIIILQITANYNQPLIPERLVLTIYEDGSSEIEYEINIDPTYPTVNVTLFGYVYEDLLVLDENELPFNYVFGANLSINSLGADFAKIYYETSDLTNKVGRYWILNFTSPIRVHVILPIEASIISLNVVPESIQSIDGKTIIIMPKGQVDVSYIIGIVGTKEYAELVIDDAEKTIEEIKALGIIINESEQLLLQAKETLSMQNFATAEELALRAKSLAIQIVDIFEKASEMILEAEKAIIEAEREGRTSGIDEVTNLLVSSKNEFNLGNYGKAFELAAEAKRMAQNIQALQTLDFFYISIILLSIVIIITILFIYIKYFRKKIPRYEKQVSNVNLDKILKKNTNLRLEDREVLELLKEAGGELYESEIRSRFNLPRTSTWRMIKRLERTGIVDIRKLGGQNLIKVKKEYCY